MIKALKKVKLWRTESFKSSRVDKQICQCNKSDWARSSLFKFIFIYCINYSQAAINFPRSSFYLFIALSKIKIKILVIHFTAFYWLGNFKVLNNFKNFLYGQCTQWTNNKIIKHGYKRHFLIEYFNDIIFL